MSDEISKLRDEINALKEENEILKRENGSLKAEKVDQSKKISSEKRFVPNWLIEVLAWIDRIEMAKSSLSIASITFKQLCWPKLHLNVKPHKIQNLEFAQIYYSLSKVKTLLQFKPYQYIPIISIPLPNYIVGIGFFHLSFLDEHIMNFIKINIHLFQNCTFLFNIDRNWKIDEKFIVSIKSLMNILTVDKMFKLVLHNGWNLNKFDSLFPGTINDFQSITYNGIYLDNDIILNWLTNQLINGRKQKILDISASNLELMTLLVNCIREEFSNSNAPAIFLIRFCPIQQLQNIDEFTQENLRTNEILAFYHKMDVWSPMKYYLIRYPRGEEHWKEEGENKILVFRPESTIINIVDKNLQN